MSTARDSDNGQEAQPPAGGTDRFAVPPFLRLALRLLPVQAFDPKAGDPEGVVAGLVASCAGNEQLPDLPIGEAFAELARRRRIAQAGAAPPDGFPGLEIIIDGGWLAGHLHPSRLRRAWPPDRYRRRQRRRRLGKICALGRSVNIRVHMVVADDSAGQQPGHPLAACRRSAPRAWCAIWGRRPASPPG